MPKTAFLLTQLLFLMLTLAGCADSWMLPVDPDGDGYSIEQGDCNNKDAQTYPGAKELCDGVDNDCDGKADQDIDDDGYLDCSGCTNQIKCKDCDDLDPNTYPSAPESCDGKDNDCNGEADHDKDQDGHCASEDCDDTDSAVHPNAPELCDGIDNDCDGLSEDPQSDGDGDGYSVCSATENDCNDSHSGIHPGAVETCNNIDDDCNGLTDDPQEAFDQDGDFTSDCIDNDQDGLTELQGDCNDLNSLTYPEAPEFFDGEDNDCDERVDESLSNQDADDDGYSTATGDCDDNNPAIHPMAPEACNDIDEDCDRAIDEGVATLWLVDLDQDGYGTEEGLTLCSNPGPFYATVGGDCDDDNAAINPQAKETCDGVDNNCNGEADEWPDEGVTYYLDNDNDGFGQTGITVVSGCELPAGFAPTGFDCDDTAPDINPGQPEICGDALDNDCDGWVDEPSDILYRTWVQVYDLGDPNYGESKTMTLRIFALAALFGSAPLLTNTDGCCEEQTYYADTDGDGYGDDDNTVTACDVPAGYVEEGGDCNDRDPLSNPSAEEIPCDGLDNDCDGRVDEGSDCEDAVELCRETNGQWDECGSGCGPATCDNPQPGDVCDDVCVAQCACPDDAPYWDSEEGCIERSDCEVVDNDGDGYPADEDCDDEDPNINPRAEEVCDGVDNDCDRIVDEGCNDEVAMCRETGGEWNDCGSGCGPATCDNPEPGDVCPDVCVAQCECPDDAPYWDSEEGCVERSDCEVVDNDGDGYPADEDCDDENPNINPRAEEVCDGVDNDCDRIVDEGCNDDVAMCRETGGDWNDCGSGCGPVTCDNPEPGEICPDVCVAQCECPDDAPLWDEELGCHSENVCDGRVDQDMDGYPASEDCNDLNPDIHPDRGEPCSCDGVDDDCNGLVDDMDCDLGCPIYEDADGDGYAGNIDCDERNPDINPGQIEVCGDGLDNDCDGVLEEGCEENPERSFLCESTGGEWILGCSPNTCETPCGETCIECIEAVEICSCPDWAPIWTEEDGCITENMCEK